ncbi:MULTISPECIES: hypothetical protein [unclassified Micromonospora]|uniref:hypothetical protein n=1 Tax=unclassified Micromonospora TaxID=2617518 RepID=UPI001B38A28E|nr:MULTISPECIES: hypothetical protein [unclassified Micromonospora]MBQ1043474.1 hypothetical protein [Micromonospora sp. C72]MBQ1053617.1 hypothetical protein [Micromonospora sp. C32]
MSISLDEAVELTRTGDLWVFRGRSVPDRAIQITTNSPVNHVGMAVVLDDMPPLMWHAELGRSLPDMWTGTHQRGVQLHDLRDAVCVWGNRYGQRGWLRQLEPPADPAMEEAVLRTVARLDGTPFPSTAQLAWRWARGRLPRPRRLSLGGLRGKAGDRNQTGILSRIIDRGENGSQGRAGGTGSQGRAGDAGARGETGDTSRENAAALETAYCAEVVAVTYETMGLLPTGRRPNWYDPGRFWSGDDLALSGGAQLGAEIEVRIPPR